MELNNTSLFTARDSATNHYLKLSIQTASTIVINHIASIGGADIQHLGISKTYKHLRGQYTNDDPPIWVDSYDGVGRFILTIDNLIDRPKTRQVIEATLGQNIAKEYPGQYLLIMGILNPIDTSEELKDGVIFKTKIFGIEPQEVTLLDRLQNYVDAFRNKYDLNLYKLTDEYFDHAYLAMLHYAIVVFILNIRLENIHTEEAHSFHVTNNLISHGLAQRDISLIPYVTRMHLYKNINYISNEIGKQNVFLRTLNWLSDYTDVCFTGYQPHLGNDDNDNIITGFLPVPLMNSSTNVLSVSEYENSTEKIMNIEDDLLIDETPSIGYTKVILTSSHSTPVGSIVNINDFAFYMLLYLVQSGKYVGDVISKMTSSTDIPMVTSMLVTGILKELGLSESLSCSLTLPVVYDDMGLDDTYIEKVRDQLSLLGDSTHEALDVIILENIKTPVLPSPGEFITFIIDRYNVLLKLQAHVAVQADEIRLVLQDVLYHLYPPIEDLKLYARGVMFDDIITDESHAMEDFMALFKTLTTIDFTHAMGPWLDAIVNIANELTTYSTRFTVNNNMKYADVAIEPLEILEVTITH